MSDDHALQWAPSWEASDSPASELLPAWTEQRSGTSIRPDEGVLLLQRSGRMQHGHEVAQDRIHIRAPLWNCRFPVLTFSNLMKLIGLARICTEPIRPTVILHHKQWLGQASTSRQGFYVHSDDVTLCLHCLHCTTLARSLGTAPSTVHRVDTFCSIQNAWLHYDSCMV